MHLDAVDDDGFKGFFIQAQRDGDDTPLGEFVEIDDDTLWVSLGPADNIVIQQSQKNKTFTSNVRQKLVLIAEMIGHYYAFLVLCPRQVLLISNMETFRGA